MVQVQIPYKLSCAGWASARHVPEVFIAHIARLHINNKVMAGVVVLVVVVRGGKAPMAGKEGVSALRLQDAGIQVCGRHCGFQALKVNESVEGIILHHCLHELVTKAVMRLTHLLSPLMLAVNAERTLHHSLFGGDGSVGMEDN
ncbi:hypothetical protein O3P69_008756 [Scylla paramamosain]|uniref:Uncharacterized protein n=1 Tax=Scylla paramamosain TaxID=85552 RepID=A0AAW0SMT2_SCYPA